MWGGIYISLGAGIEAMRYYRSVLNLSKPIATSQPARTNAPIATPLRRKRIHYANGGWLGPFWTVLDRYSLWRFLFPSLKWCARISTTSSNGLSAIYLSEWLISAASRAVGLVAFGGKSVTKTGYLVRTVSREGLFAMATEQSPRGRIAARKRETRRIN